MDTDMQRLNMRFRDSPILPMQKAASADAANAVKNASRMHTVSLQGKALQRRHSSHMARKALNKQRVSNSSAREPPNAQ